jgi:menaquinone-dependent protoporphyrinogen oxidase
LHIIATIAMSMFTVAVMAFGAFAHGTRFRLEKDNRKMRMLIGYASRFGSTRDIAIRIAGAVRSHGNEVDVRSVDEISDFDPYDAVVFGSGVYDGSWTTEATDLVRRHAAVLARKPVWLFSVGSFGDRHPIVGALIKKEPKEIGEFEQTVRPRDYRVFAGVIDLDHWPAWGRLLFKALGGRAGDNRQWPDIDSWAEEISREIRSQD